MYMVYYREETAEGLAVVSGGANEGSSFGRAFHGGRPQRYFPFTTVVLALPVSNSGPCCGRARVFQFCYIQ